MSIRSLIPHPAGLRPRYVDIAQLEEDERSKPPEPLGDTFTQGLFAAPLDPAELLPRRAAKREAEATDGSDSKHRCYLNCGGVGGQGGGS